eukprot:m.205053 g.205053  ORF g.205053 m.205053 type:complete len:322 (+) comp18871_c0_seq96:128-1093(+)
MYTHGFRKRDFVKRCMCCNRVYDCMMSAWSGMNRSLHRERRPHAAECLLAIQDLLASSRNESALLSTINALGKGVARREASVASTTSYKSALSDFEEPHLGASSSAIDEIRSTDRDLETDEGHDRYLEVATGSSPDSDNDANDANDSAAESEIRVTSVCPPRNAIQKLFNEMEPLGVDPAQARRYDMTDVVKADEVFADKLQDFWTTVKRRGLAPNAGIDVTMLPTCALSPRAFLHSLGAAIQHACIPATPSASPVDRLMSVAQWYFHVLQSGMFRRKHATMLYTALMQIPSSSDCFQKHFCMPFHACHASEHSKDPVILL